VEEFDKEFYGRRNEGHLDGDQTLYLPPGKEYDLFAEYVSSV
jgi:hypothetical protein